MHLLTSSSLIAATFRRLHPLVIVIALSCANQTNADQSIEGVEKEIQSMSERLQQLHAEIESGRKLKAALQNSLEQTSSKVSERASRIKGLQKDIDTYNAQLDKLDARIAIEQANNDQRKSTLAASLRGSQRLATSSGLKVLLQSNNPAQSARLGVYTGYFMRAQQAAIDSQQQALQQVALAREEALKNRNWLNYIKKKATSQFDSYKQQRNKNQASIGQVENDLSNKTKTVAEIKQDQQRLQSLMEELRAAQIAKSGYFVANRGHYGLPVTGRIQARFGDIKSVGKLTWNGYFVAADLGLPVRAIADGTVVYSDWLQGFGMLVILDHGDGYMTLYGGNRDVAVQKGDWSETGATIATVGDSGGQKTTGVYFEIRHNAKPIDPKGWVNAKNTVKSAKK